MTDSAATPARHDERVDPLHAEPAMAAQNLVRYDWAARFLPAGRVLDCACGVGYGSAILRERGAGEVIAIDNCPQTLAEARRRYGRPGIEFVQADAFALQPAELGAFDLIVCLETLEHVAEPQRLLDVFGHLLASTGRLLVSVPNDLHLGGDNPYHLWRGTFAEVSGWLAQRFAHISVYAQVQNLGSAVWPRAVAEQRAPDEPPADSTIRLLDTLPIERSQAFLFACGSSPLPPVAPVSAELLDGLGYVRELEDVRDKLWAEAQRLAAGWEEQKRYIEALEKEHQKVLAELGEQRALAERQAARIHELEAQRPRR